VVILGNAVAGEIPDIVRQSGPRKFKVEIDDEHVSLTKAHSDERLIVLRNDDASHNRMLFIIKQDSSNKAWRILAKSENAIPSTDCGGSYGDCFSGLKYMKQGFAINLYGGGWDRWWNEFWFRYSNRDGTWELIKAEEGSYRMENDAITAEDKKEYRPPHDFGKITITNFDPYNYLGQGEK
jgi:hypothetical protein